MSTPIQIAACQFLVREARDFKQFADHVNGLLDQAKDAILVLLPELFTTELFTTLPDWRKRPFADLIDIRNGEISITCCGGCARRAGKPRTEPSIRNTR
jgi:predicted amidohydrolase